MQRGGAYYDGTNAGLFKLNRDTGSGTERWSFRSVLSCLNYGLKIVKKWFFKTQIEVLE